MYLREMRRIGGGYVDLSQRNENIVGLVPVDISYSYERQWLGRYVDMYTRISNRYVHITMYIVHI